MANQDAGFAQGDPALDIHAPLPYRWRPDVNVTSAADAKSGTRNYFARIANTGEVFELGEQEMFICSRLDGRVSFSELTTSLQARFDTQISFDAFRQFAERLVEMAIVERVAPGDAPFSARAAGGTSDDKADPRFGLFRYRLFDPTRILDFLASFHAVARVLAWLAVPLFVLAVGIVGHLFQAMSHDTRIVVVSLSILIQWPISMAVDNLFTKFVQGATARYNGARVKVLGLTIMLGFFPRLYIDHDDILRLDRRSQMRIFIAPLLTRVMLFSLTLMLWAALRPYRTDLSYFFILLAHQSLAAFLLTVMPFWQSDGYHWLAAYLDRPYLHERTFRYFRLLLSGKPAPEEMSAADKVTSVIFAGFSVIGCVACIGLVLLYFAIGFEWRLGGAGIAVFAGILSLTLLWLYFMRRSVLAIHARAQAMQSSERAERRATPARTAAYVPDEASVIPLSRGTPATGSARLDTREKSPVRRYVMLALLAGFIVVLLLPYQYKPGGDFVVLPTRRADLVAEVQGKVSAILVKEGQWVRKGQPIARLDNTDVEHNVAVRKADLAKARADLQSLLDGSKPEHVALAESEVRDAEVVLAYDQAEVRRAKSLAATGAASQRTVEQAVTDLQKAQAEVLVKRANLKLVKSPPKPAEVAAARSKVESLEQDLVYQQQQYNDLTIRTPISGRIVTPDLDLLYGKYLHVGDAIAQVEDNRTARVEVNLSQEDVQYIRKGDDADVVPWSYSGSTMYGKVVLIGAAAKTVSGDQVVKVTIDLPNPKDRLRSQMTGYAKVRGADMMVWQAYTLWLVRFFQVEVWSWFP